MGNVRYQFESNFDLTRFGPAFDRESLVSMTDVVRIVEASVELNTPRDTGRAQGEVQKNVQLLRDAVQGDVYSSDDPAKIAALETGRSAGSAFPNIELLSQWMVRKGIEPKKLFIIARSIAAKGIPARHTFKKSWESTEKDVDRILIDLLPEKVMKAL